MDGPIRTTARRRGRPHRYLLSSIAMCGVCGAPTRVGTQNTGAPRSSDVAEQPSRYKVYECAGLSDDAASSGDTGFPAGRASPGGSGFHVSMHQEHLDKIVTDAVLARVRRPDFQPPHVVPGDVDGAMRRALRLQIKGHWAWLDKVQKEARRKKRPSTLIGQQQIVLPMIEAAQARIDELDELDPVVQKLAEAESVLYAWLRMPLEQQRHVVQVLLVPRINPVEAGEQGRRGVNAERVELEWREEV